MDFERCGAVWFWQVKRFGACGYGQIKSFGAVWFWTSMGWAVVVMTVWSAGGELTELPTRVYA